MGKDVEQIALHERELQRSRLACAARENAPGNVRPLSGCSSKSRGLGHHTVSRIAMVFDPKACRFKPSIIYQYQFSEIYKWIETRDQGKTLRI